MALDPLTAALECLRLGLELALIREKALPPDLQQEKAIAIWEVNSRFLTVMGNILEFLTTKRGMEMTDDQKKELTGLIEKANPFNLIHKKDAKQDPPPPADGGDKS